jgi:hypothetical protein
MAWWHTEWWHNLAFRPDKPALGYGARRAPRCGSRHALSASQVLEWAYPRKFYRAERFAHHDQRSTRRALERIARISNGSPTRLEDRPSCPTTI